MSTKPGALRELQNKFESVYLIKDPYILKMLLATVISQDLSSDPVWVIIVAPSGGAKSEFINAISQCSGVMQLSTLSSNTFVSGARNAGHETSLLNRLNEGTDQQGNGILTFKDMTSLLSEHKDDRAVIMAQLREIYDGHYSKAFGTGQTVNWDGKITIIAGSTYAIHTLKASYTAMGERFIMYNMIQPDRIEAANKAMENQESGLMKEQRLMLVKATAQYKNKDLVLPKETPKITKEFKNSLLSLAELSTRARSDVERNYRSPQQEITEVHPPEMPTRFAASLQTMARSLMVINWNEYNRMEILPEDVIILNKLALDSITKSRRIAMQELSRYNSITTAGIATKLGLPTNSVRKWLEDLTALEIVKREKGSGSQGDKWNILPHYKEIVQKFENITDEGIDLVDNEEPTGSIITQEEINEAMKS